MDVTIEQLGSLGELIAAVATVFTLVYLAAQIRQNSRMLQASSAAAHTSSMDTIGSILAQDPQLCELYFDGLAGTFSFGPGQQRQFEMLVGIFMNILQQNCDLEEQGVLSANLSSVLHGQIEWIASQPGFRAYWDRLGPQHSPTARARISKAMAARN